MSYEFIEDNNSLSRSSTRPISAWVTSILLTHIVPLPPQATDEIRFPCNFAKCVALGCVGTSFVAISPCCNGRIE